MNTKKAVLIASILLFMVLGVYFLYMANSEMPESSQSRITNAFDPRNASYTIDGNSISLADGNSENFRILGEPIRGDLNHDGREDAALILVSDGSEPSAYVAVALHSPEGGTLGTNALLLDKSSSAPLLEIKNKSLIVNDNMYFYIWGMELREVPTRNEFLEIESPKPYETIGNPVTVSGRSNFNEANTRIRIKDAAGNVLADTFTTAQGWMSALYPFSSEIPYEKPTTLDGAVEIFEESAEDGSEVHKVIIPVSFAYSS